MYCPKCGTQINKGAAFCPQCGTPQSSIDTKTKATKNSFETNEDSSKTKFNPYPPQNEKIKKPKKRRRWLKYSMIIVISMIVVFFTILIISEIIMENERKKQLTRYDFPSNEESIELIKAIQGKWIYYENTESSEYEISVAFKGNNQYSETSDLISTISTSNFIEFGKFAIDTEKDMIYLIPDNFDYFDPNEEPHTIIYDYNSDTDEYSIFYKGYKLTYYG